MSRPARPARPACDTRGALATIDPRKALGSATRRSRCDEASVPSPLLHCHLSDHQAQVDTAVVRKRAGLGELDGTKHNSCGRACYRRRAEVEAASGAHDRVYDADVVISPYDGIADMDGEDLPFAAIERGTRDGEVPLGGYAGARACTAPHAGVGAAAAAGAAGAAAAAAAGRSGGRVVGAASSDHRPAAA